MTQDVPQTPSSSVPRHVAVIMDGNGRWARQRGKPRTAGHRAGVRSVRRIVRQAARRGVEVLTLFAFSQENWKRPEVEVKLLMQLFRLTLDREVKTLHKNGIRIRFIGDHAGFSDDLRAQMQKAEALTADNDGLVLVIAVGYGGQWDLLQAAQRLAAEGRPIDAENLSAALSTAEFPDPDLLIRTGGESRISNFMLWQLAYTELYFSPVLWPDFDDDAFAEAMAWYVGRERRYGRVPEAA